MSVEPWINWQFHKAPGMIDRRASFTRASLGRTVNRLGTLAAVPANTARFRFNPITGLSEGLLVEPQRTNLLLRSEEFNDAGWTKTSLTVTANSAAAPDGTTTADTLTATGAGGNVAQAVTITAGRGIALSVFAKASASSWLRLALTDGTNLVECWFNLSAGTVEASTAGAGTNLFSQKTIEAHANGWFRCALETTTVTSTAFTASIAPAAADSAAPANTDAILAWGAQLEAEATLTNATTYIPTVAATVTRSADNLILPVTAAQAPLDRGTMVFEITARPIPPVSGGQAIVLGGIGNTFDNTLYLSRSGGSASVAVAYLSGGVAAGSLPSRPLGYVPGTTYRIGTTWQPGRVAICVDGSAISAGTLGITPFASVARIAVGCAPWSSSSAGTVSNMTHRAFLYAPQTVSDAVLQQLTAP
jgi:hypothetical protein